MENPREKFEKDVVAFRKLQREYEEKIKGKEAEAEKERAKPQKLRTRKLSEIRDEISQMRNQLWKTEPKKHCSHCGLELSYDAIICWKCGEVFLDVCPKCSNIRIERSEWGGIKCLECGFEYRENDLLDELLAGFADPNNSRLDILSRHQVSGLNCYNIGIKSHTIWELCKKYNCPFEEKCEYYCPAFLSVLGLITRGKVTTGLPWGYDRGGDLHGYLIRWRRQKNTIE